MSCNCIISVWYFLHMNCGMDRITFILVPLLATVSWEYLRKTFFKKQRCNYRIITKMTVIKNLCVLYRNTTSFLWMNKFKKCVYKLQKAIIKENSFHKGSWFTFCSSMAQNSFNEEWPTTLKRFTREWFWNISSTPFVTDVQNYVTQNLRSKQNVGKLMETCMIQFSYFHNFITKFLPLSYNPLINQSRV